jgi:O-antigen/teichoic acid export membrane protein
LGILQASFLMSAFRSDGLYAFGVAGLNVMRVLENIGIWVALFTTHRPLYVAVVGASVRIVGTGILYLFLRRKLPWLTVGFSRASWRRTRELARPAFAFMAFPAGNGISIQGMTVLIGLTLGPIAVATFNPMRTLSRFAYQILDSIKNAMWPELSAAYGAKNWDLARKLHRTCCQVAFWLAILAVGGLAITGPTIFRLWTHNRVVMDIPCFYLLLAVVVASSLWNTSSAVPIAANRHEGLALRYVVGTSVSLLLAYLLLPQFHLQGAAIALLASDVWMGCFVIRGSNSLLKDNTQDFLRSMIQVDRLKLLLAR